MFTSFTSYLKVAFFDASQSRLLSMASKNIGSSKISLQFSVKNSGVFRSAENCNLLFGRPFPSNFPIDFS